MMAEPCPNKEELPHMASASGNDAKARQRITTLSCFSEN